MADDFLGDDDFATPPASGNVNPAALDAALNGPAATTKEARAFLREQEALTRLQAKILHAEHAFELSHLKWRRFNDQMKGTLQIMVAAAGVLVFVAIAAAIWNASQADGIVVDSFSVPLQFAQAGMAGDVIADDLTNRVAAVRDFANLHSIAHSKAVRNERAEEIKVEIPETGVSLAEVSRYLRSWLGHERHLSGNVRVMDGGRIVLTVALDGADATSFVGRVGDLDHLEQQAAEHVFQDVDPSNYVLYLYGKNRPAEAEAAIRHLIQIADSPGMLSDGYSLWSNWTRNFVGDLSLSLKRGRIAADTDPRALPPHMEMMAEYQYLGRDEEALHEALLIPGFKQEDQYAWREGAGFGQVLELARWISDSAAGDFRQAARDECGWCDRSEKFLGWSEFAARLHDIAWSRALIAAAGSMDQVDPALLNRAAYFADAAVGNWRRAASDARSYGAASTSRNPRLQAIKLRTGISPLLAVALAHEGKFGQAHAEIDRTPRDCVLCEEAHAEIDALEHNLGGAAWWFARAARDASSIPFAETDWGEMLLRRGDYDAAITKFREANQRGPHFADPLEMWGEALIQENRSDLALVKFAEADKYATDWGRLHLEWGKALAYLGRTNEAQQQFATASHLDLSAGDAAALSKWSARHV